MCIVFYSCLLAFLMLFAQWVIFPHGDSRVLSHADTNWSYLLSRDTGAQIKSKRHTALISGSNVSYVKIAGKGAIDGRGHPWWVKEHHGTLQYGRPHLIEVSFCDHLIVENLHLKNSPFWTLHPYACHHVLVDNLTISAPRNSPNTDGIDPDSCSGDPSCPMWVLCLFLFRDCWILHSSLKAFYLSRDQFQNYIYFSPHSLWLQHEWVHWQRWFIKISIYYILSFWCEPCLTLISFLYIARCGNQEYCDRCWWRCCGH